MPWATVCGPRNFAGEPIASLTGLLVGEAEGGFSGDNITCGSAVEGLGFFTGDAICKKKNKRYIKHGSQNSCKYKEWLHCVQKGITNLAM